MVAVHPRLADAPAGPVRLADVNSAKGQIQRRLIGGEALAPDVAIAYARSYPLFFSAKRELEQQGVYFETVHVGRVGYYQLREDVAEALRVTLKPRPAGCSEAGPGAAADRLARVERQVRSLQRRVARLSLRERT